MRKLLWERQTIALSSLFSHHLVLSSGPWALSYFPPRFPVSILHTAAAANRKVSGRPIPDSFWTLTGGGFSEPLLATGLPPLRIH